MALTFSATRHALHKQGIGGQKGIEENHNKEPHARQLAT
jgi:hypothetical protein